MNELEWSKGRLEKVRLCPACASNERGGICHVRRDNEGLFEDVWRFVQCARCLSFFLDPRPSPDTVGSAYDEYYTHEPSDGTVFTVAGRFILPAIHGYLWLRFRMRRFPRNIVAGSLFYLVEPLRLKLDYYARHLSRRSGSVFDAGCGNGDFLLRARDMGWKTSGCDPDPKAVETARKLGLDVVQGFPEDVLKDHRDLDVVTMGHVIEHVASPERLIKACHSALRPGGHLWLATPNPLSTGFRRLGKCWMPLHPPYHFCIFHPEAIKALLEHVGFNKIHFYRRGMQSPDQWRQARGIAKREGLALSSLRVTLTRWISDFRATVDPLGAEEYVISAEKKDTG